MKYCSFNYFLLYLITRGFIQNPHEGSYRMLTFEPIQFVFHGVHFFLHSIELFSELMNIQVYEALNKRLSLVDEGI